MTNKYFITQWPNIQFESQVVIHLTYCELEKGKFHRVDSYITSFLLTSICIGSSDHLSYFNTDEL